MGGFSFKFLLTVGLAAAKTVIQEASEKFLTPEAREKINDTLAKAKGAGEDTIINVLKEHAPDFLDKVAKAKGYNDEKGLTKDDIKDILAEFQKQQAAAAPKAEEPKKPAAKKKNPPGNKGNTPKK